MSKLDLAPTQLLAISPDRVSGTLGAAHHGKSPRDGASSDQAGGALLYTDSSKIPCRSCAIMVPYALPIQTGTSWEPSSRRHCLRGCAARLATRAGVP